MEEMNMSAVVDEIKEATEEELKQVIEKWFNSTHVDGMKLGAYMISAAVFDTINKNLKSGMSSSHRDFERAIKGIIEIVSVQLKKETQQNDSEDVEETVDDGTAE
jgi:hypothetical protein